MKQGNTFLLLCACVFFRRATHSQDIRMHRRWDFPFISHWNKIHMKHKTRGMTLFQSGREETQHFLCHIVSFILCIWLYCNILSKYTSRPCTVFTLFLPLYKIKYSSSLSFLQYALYIFSWKWMDMLVFRPPLSH